MDRYAIFVDAGYLMSQSLRILSGKESAARSELRVLNPAELIADLMKRAEGAFGHSRLLRTYWYDGVGNSMTAEQISIAVLPDVQFRAGTIHNKKQKGVDSRIVHDLFELASNHAIADAMVVTGDGDLAVGIEFAQRRGMRVALLSVEDIPNGISANRHPELSYLADRQLTIGKVEVEKLFRHEPPSAKAVPQPALAVAAPPPVVVAVPLPVPAPGKAHSVEETLELVVKQLVAELPAATVATSLNAAGGIVGAIDKKLLFNAKTALARLLETSERNLLRKMFTESVQPPK